MEVPQDVTIASVVFPLSLSLTMDASNSGVREPSNDPTLFPMYEMISS